MAPQTKKPVTRQAVNQFSIGCRASIADIGQQRHKTSSLYSIRNSVLADCCATCFASGNQAAMTIHKFLKQFDILVINIHGPRSFAVDVQRILTNGFDFDLRFLSNEFFLKLCQANNPLHKTNVKIFRLQNLVSAVEVKGREPNQKRFSAKRSAIARAGYYANCGYFRKALSFQIGLKIARRSALLCDSRFSDSHFCKSSGRAALVRNPSRKGWDGSEVFRGLVA
jgi:hypothetical protein